MPFTDEQDAAWKQKREADRAKQEAKDRARGLVELWDKDGVYLILDDPLGVPITNQTHGVSCYHPEAIGRLLRLDDTSTDRYADAPHVGCFGGLDDEDCNALDLWLRDIIKVSCVVDRERVASDGTPGDGGPRIYGEAWVPVRFQGAPAILTYENCD